MRHRAYEKPYNPETGSLQEAKPHAATGLVRAVVPLPKGRSKRLVASETTREALDCVSGRLSVRQLWPNTASSPICLGCDVC